MSGFLAKGHLPPVSNQPRLSANGKGDNEVTPGAVHRSVICLTADDPRETSARRPSMKVFATGHRLKWNPLPPNNVGRIAQDVRKGEKGTD